jgi:hypothetical protein
VKSKKKFFYLTLAEASMAAKALGFTSGKEYRIGRHQDPRLPSSPNLFYKDEWESFPSLLGKDVVVFYPTLFEASVAVKALGFTSGKEYTIGRHQDPRLPSSPNVFYKDEWESWPSFLDKDVVVFYPTLFEASVVVKALGFTSGKEYRIGRHQDPRLPSDPCVFYKDEWESLPSFLGKDVVVFYPTLFEASVAVKYLGFTSGKEYTMERHQDPRLPSAPYKLYKDEWENWPIFLGTNDCLYPTLFEASMAVKALGFTSVKEYIIGRHQDSRLPSRPHVFYKDEWERWPVFLGKKVASFYPTLFEASVAAKALGFTSGKEYTIGRHQDSRLPSEPHKFYKDGWESWPSFLGKGVFSYYPTLFEASVAAKALGFTSGKEYKFGRHQDLRLPPRPEKVYKDEWESWPVFLCSGLIISYQMIGGKLHQSRGINKHEQTNIYNRI